MTWAPFTSKHAIERARIVIHFAQPIQMKQVATLAEIAERRRAELGFAARVSVPTNVIEVDQKTGDARIAKQPSGWSLSVEAEDGRTVEALALNPQFLIYEASKYDRWAGFWDRYDAITADVRTKIAADIDVRAVALEYVDRFAFEGPPSDAAPGLLIREAIVGSLPEPARSGREAWHVHRGWFEGEEPHRFLVNQNIDAQSILDDDRNETRGVGIMTKVERQRPSDQDAATDLDISSLPDDIEAMHTVSKRVMCDALQDDMCTRVGLT